MIEWLRGWIHCIVYREHAFEERCRYDVEYTTVDGLDVEIEPGERVVEHCQYCGETRRRRSE